MAFEYGFQDVPLARLRVWADNPRRTIDAAKLDELAKSVRAIGVQQPLVARPCGDGLEVIAGQRRFLAASIAGLSEVPCIVRALDDDQALEVAIAENAARADVSPIEEAESIEAYLRKGRTVDQAADRFGRTPAWVERRVRLLSLTPDWRARVAADTCPLRHAELLAGLASAVQDALHSRFSNRELPAYYEFERAVQLSLHQLSEAPFPLADDSYPGGSCDACPSRSDKQRDLFSGETLDDASCLAPACWAAKVEHLWTVAQRDAKKRRLRVLSADEARITDNGIALPSSEWVEMARASRYGVAARAIARTRDGLVIELASHEEYNRGAEAELEKLKQERDARKATTQTSARDEADESDEADEPATPAPRATATDTRAMDREKMLRALPLIAARLPGSLDVLRAIVTECASWASDGIDSEVRECVGHSRQSQWSEANERDCLVAICLYAIGDQTGDAAQRVASVAAGVAEDDADVARMVERFAGEIEAARVADDLIAAWRAIMSEDHRASLPALAGLWLARAKAIGMKPTMLRNLRKSGDAPAAELTKEAA